MEIASVEVTPVPVKSSEKETRRLTMKDRGERTFDFLVIDRPEKWKPAEEFSSIFEMPIVGSQKKIRFNLSGVSLKSWEDVELEHPIPEWTGEGPPDADHQARKDQAVSEKFAHVFELALGKKLPGGTWAEKSTTLKQLNPGETQALYLFTQNNACNYRDGDLLASYNEAVSNRADSDSDVVEFNSFEEWKVATESAYAFRMHRPFEDYITEFPLKNITADDRSRIENECRDPEPPRKPKRDPKTKRLIGGGETEPDFQDQHWLARCRAVNQKKLIMYLNICLPFQIPGANQLEQYEWVSQRLMGDVVRLKDFIEQELCGYASRYNFFTRF